MSDNGASAEGGAKGSFNEQYFFNLVPESLEENLRRIDDLGGPLANNHYPWGWAWAGNTPLQAVQARHARRRRRGPADRPLAERHRHRGRDARPVRARDRRDADAARPHRHRSARCHRGRGAASDRRRELRTHPRPPRRHRARTSRSTTRCSDLARSTTTVGRRWCSTRRRSSTTTAATCASRSHDDKWELYHVADDFAEVNDLAEEQPEKLAELQQLWWQEAAKYQVLPLNNEPGRFGDTRYRRDHYELYGGIGPLPEAIAPNFRNRSFTIAAALDVPAAADIDGVIVAHGCHAGGYVVYLRDRRLHYTYNFVGTEITTISAGSDLPDGPGHGAHRVQPGRTRSGRQRRAVLRRRRRGQRDGLSARHCSHTAHPASRSATSR